jgi:hypothetical protein
VAARFLSLFELCRDYVTSACLMIRKMKVFFIVINQCDDDNEWPG